MEGIYGMFSLMLAVFGWVIGQMFMISKKIGRLEGKINKIEFALFGNDPGPEDGIYPLVDSLVSFKKTLEEMKQHGNRTSV